MEQELSSLIELLEKNGENRLEYKTLREQMRRILSKDKRGELVSLIPNSYLRKWFLADIRIALRKKKIKDIVLYLQHALGIIKVQRIRIGIESGEAQKLLIKKEDLKKGDIVLSYKTKSFLDKEFLSKLIAKAAYTSITHSSIVCEDEKGELRKLTSYAQTWGLDALDLTPESGEIFFILSADPNFKYTQKLHKEIDNWYNMVRHKKDSLRMRWKLRFSETKCWSACVSGFVFTTTMRLTGAYIVIPNPLWLVSGYYCSEILDIMFKRVGVTLSARTRRPALLGPSDMMYSPYLQFKGLMATPQDIAVLETEKIII